MDDAVEDGDSAPPMPAAGFLARMAIKPDKPPALTRRERDCLALVAQGYSDGGIAARLGIKPVTAHAHIESAKRKLGARTRAHAVALAFLAQVPSAHEPP